VLWSFEDDDVDAILRANGAGGYDILTSGTLSVGDVFWSVFEVPVFTIGGSNGIPAGLELTGVAAVQLTSVIPSPAPGGIGTVYNFGVFTGFNSVLTSYGYAGAPLPAGTAIAMFFNGAPGAPGDIDLDVNRTSNPATNCPTVAYCSYQATLGTALQQDGFGLDLDEFWYSVQSAPGGGDIGTVLGTNNALSVATANFGLSNFFNAGGPVEFIDIASGLPCGNPGYIADGCVQLTGKVEVTGGQGLSNDFIAHSDFDGQKYVVPEPATLSLLGLGLLGLGMVRKFKKS
jgi:hypothetical protein